MKLRLPNQFPIEEDGNVLKLENQTFIQLYRREESFKHYVNLERHLIVLVLQGTKLMMSTEEDFTIHKNELLFLEKGAYLAYEKQLEDGVFSAIIFSFEDHFLNKFKEEYRQYLAKNETPMNSKMFKLEASSELETYIESLMPCFGKQKIMAAPMLRLKINELLLCLLFSDRKKEFSHYLSSLGHVQNSSFKETVEQSTFKNLTIGERAFLFQLSTSSFKRKFKEIFNDSPGRWFRRQKLKKAKILLRTTDKNISEIAFQVGFETPSHFTHLFKKEFGITPKQMQN